MKTFIIVAALAVTAALMSHTEVENNFYKGKAELKDFAQPDEVREFPKGKVELIKIGNATIGRATFQPGWKWSESVQPLVKTKSCEAPHFQYHVSGVLMVKMDDGTVLECKPGQVSLLPMGHDAWVVGDEPAVVVDFQGMIDYAKGKKN
ncbi:cupin domain-containing protein [Ferruginibacter sp.]